jgi:hypothetical protein
MRFKFYHYISGISFLAFLGFLLAESQVKEALYQPRESQSSTPTGIAGYMEYINSMRANEITGEVTLADIQKAENELKALSTNKTNSITWESRGPDNKGGRTRALVIDKDNSSILYSGSVGGGLFKSLNGGATWNYIGDPQHNQSIVSITQTSTGDLYVGTGELFQGYYGGGSTSSPQFAGKGVLKSTDDGASWTELTPTLSWASVPRIEADPSDPTGNTIYAATTNGFKKTTDGGTTWTSPLGGNIWDFAISPTGKLFVNRNGNTMYSTDGNNFTEISAPIITSTSLPRRASGRIRYAISPQDENYVYCVQTNGNALSAVYRSVDGGSTWSKIGQKSNNFDPLCYTNSGNPVSGNFVCQGKYDLLFSVSPHDKDLIALGGITIWSWSLTQGWVQKTTTGGGAFNPVYMHADVHDMVFDPTDPNVIYVVSDGGIAKSSDGGNSWAERNKNYNSFTQFGVSVGRDKKILGGGQDNGTIYIDGVSFLSPNSAVDVGGGDGGYAEISWLNPKVMFFESQYGFYRNNDEGGQATESFASPAMMLPGSQQKRISNFMVPMVLWETSEDLNSEDSVTFELFPGLRSMGYGDGIKKTFSGKINHSQSAVEYLPGTFQLTAGGVSASADAQGNINTSEVTGFFHPDSAYFEVTFTSAPIAEVILTCDVFLPIGSGLELSAAIGALPIDVTTTSIMNVGDVLKVQDPVQSMYFIGNASHSNATFPTMGGIWMTREAHAFGTTPEWWQIAHLGNGIYPQYMKISADGNHLFVGTSEGRLYRISNLQSARSLGDAHIDSVNKLITVDLIETFGSRNICGIDVDPNNTSRVAVSLGNYNNSNFVYYSNNALSANPTFSPKQGNLPSVPAYSVSFDKHNSNRLIVGTEWGIFMTDNLTAGLPTYTEENNGMVRVPVFEIEQYRTELNFDSTAAGSIPTEGEIFIATHGRGYYSTSSTQVQTTVGSDESEIEDNQLALGIYPNPSSNEINVPVVSGDLQINLRNFNGSIVRRIDMRRVPNGLQKISIDVSDIPSGNYLITRLQNGNTLSEIIVIQ